MTKVETKVKKTVKTLKTNQILTRTMGDFNVCQRTKDGMFNATILLKQWNDYSGQQKELKKFFDNKSTQEFISILTIKENLNRENSPYLATKGKNGGTWMHPFLFIDFAMWINPEFKYDIIKFVHDELIEQRVDAGILYKEMSKCISKVVDKEFIKKGMQNISRAINHIVFGRHESGIRNTEGCEVKIKNLVEIEKNIIMLVDCGFLTTYEEVISFLRNQWLKKRQSIS